MNTRAHGWRRTVVLVVALVAAGAGTGRLFLACAPVGGAAEEVVEGALGLSQPGDRDRTVSAVRESEEPAAAVDDAGVGGHAENAPGLGPPRRIHPRSPDEWQGMLVDLTFRQVCSASAVCGLGLACHPDGRCGPCVDDADCVEGERCVLDHCLVEDHVGCRRRSDCEADELCILSGYTAAARRGNEDMRSYCNPSSGGREQTMDWLDAELERQAEHVHPAAPPSVSGQELLDSLR